MAKRPAKKGQRSKRSTLLPWTTKADVLVSQDTLYAFVRKVAMEVDGPRGGGGPGMANFLPLPPKAKVDCATHPDCNICPFCKRHLKDAKSVCEHVITDMGSDTTWEWVAQFLGLPRAFLSINLEQSRLKAFNPDFDQETLKQVELLLTTTLAKHAKVRSKSGPAAIERALCDALATMGITGIPSKEILRHYS